MAGTTPSTQPASTPTAGNAAGIPGYTTVWTESFDSRLGQVSRTWGHVWVHDGMATVSSWAGEQWAASGMMQPPTGASTVQGFGLYSVTMVVHSSAPGAFACLWPSSDAWPGPELDFVELDGSGNPYSTIHYRGADGSDQYTTHALAGVDPRLQHTYSMEWASDHISMYVDGVLQWTQTDHIPQDAAHGGQNEAFGVGEQPAWAASYQSGDNVVDVYEMSYAAPNPGGSAPLPTPSPTPLPTPAAAADPVITPALPLGGPVDWNAIARVVVDFYAAHGWWASYGDIMAMGGGHAASPEPPPSAAPLPPVTQTIGSGVDSLVLRISQDAYQGNAQYTVQVDGQQVGGTLTAGASHAAGQDDTITVRGGWDPGSHTVSVTFTNDAYGGTPDADRNLYVDGIALDGGAVSGSTTAALLSSGTATFTVSRPAPAPTPTPVATPTATVQGTPGADTLNLNHQHSVSVDGGTGADVINLGKDHSGITILAQPGEVAGDIILSFRAGDHLEFHGYGAGATLTSIGGGHYTVAAPGHMGETFTLGGYALQSTDYAFH